MMKTAMGILALVLGCSPVGAGAAPVFSESFESVVRPPSGSFYTGDSVGVFVMGEGGGRATLLDLSTLGYPGSDGNKAFAFGLVGDGRADDVALTITLADLVAGAGYELTLDVSPLALPEDQGSWIVIATGLAGDEQWFRQSLSGTKTYVGDRAVDWYGTPANPWQTLRVPFVAPEGPLDLVIAGAGTAYPVIDRVTLMAVPEPGTVGILTITALMVLATARAARARFAASPGRSRI